MIKRTQMTMRTRPIGWTLAWALVSGVPIGLIGLFLFDGLPSVSAQADTSAPTVSSVAITSDPDENDADLGSYETGGPGRPSQRSIWASAYIASGTIYR